MKWDWILPMLIALMVFTVGAILCFRSWLSTWPAYVNPDPIPFRLHSHARP